MPVKNLLAPFRTLAPFFRANIWSLVVGLTCLLLVDLLQLLIPLVIRKAIDLLTTGMASEASLLKLGGTIMAIALAIALCRYTWRHLIFGHSRKVEEALRSKIFSHVQTLSVYFFQKYRTGDLMARAINDINAVRMATGMGLVALTDGLILGLAAIGFMISINYRLALIALIPAPVVVIITRVLTRRMATGFENVQRQFSELTERVREGLAGIWVLKAFNREAWQFEKVKAEGQLYVNHNLNLAKTMALFFPVMSVFTNAGLVIVIWLGGRKVIFGQITTGDFVAFTSYLNLLTWPMMAMGWVTNLIQRATAAMNRINALLEERPKIKSPPHPVRLNGVAGKIEITGLTVRYSEQGHPVLKDLHLKIEPRQTFALVGRVGCGKTTLLMAMVRLLDVPPATVFVDGTDIVKTDLRQLRRAIGFVPQQSQLFSDTIRNNILMGRSHISEEQLRRALSIARIVDEIDQLEEGLDTIVGERGATLSGGQRQRIALARGIVENPPILILDDALSMVDMETENEIMAELLHIRKNKTTIIVSHRTTTIASADKIAIMAEGKIIDTGQHRALLERNELYKNLYEQRMYSEELQRIQIDD